MKTIKQLADELHKSKPAIMQKIDELGLRSALQTEKNKLLVNEEQEILIKKAFEDKSQSKTETTSQSGSQSDLRLVVDLLEKENAKKDETIAKLLQQLEIASENLKNEQILHGQAKAENQLLLEMWQADKDKVVEYERIVEEERNKKWWQKLLKG